MSRAALYLRVSTDEQAEHGYSLPEQIRELRAYAGREGIVVIEEIVDDGWSGAVGIRPGLDRIMELARNGEIEVALATKRDRFSAQRTTRSSTPTSYPSSGSRSAPWTTRGTGSGMRSTGSSASSSAKGSGRTPRRAGWRRPARAELMGSWKPLYGFEYADEEKNSYVVAPEKMAVVGRIMAMLPVGESIRTVQRTLEAEGILAPGGGATWGAYTLRQIVASDAYRPYSYGGAGAAAGSRREHRRLQARPGPLLRHLLVSEREDYAVGTGQGARLRPLAAGRPEAPRGAGADPGYRLRPRPRNDRPGAAGARGEPHEPQHWRAGIPARGAHLLRRVRPAAHL